METEANLTSGQGGLGQGRLKERTPVAVIDIGSNSVRQVVYEGLARSTSVLFNEKVLAGLGRGMVSTGRLDDIAVARALRAIERFVKIGKQIKVGKTHIIATAAARDAKNGLDFIRKVEDISGTTVEVLTGAMEAKYSALGIKSGFHNPNGIVGDMGGGSLELVGVNGVIAEGITLPLGGIRLAEAANDDLDKAIEIANSELSQAKVAWPGEEKTFYAIGGTWRSLGKLHIAHTKYALASVHDYEVPADEMMAFCEQIISEGLKEIKGVNAVSKNRRELLPMGAIVMRATLKHLGAEKIVFSSLGVREGVLYALLSDKEKQKDALLSAAKDLSILRARTPEHCLELAQWSGKAFATLGIKEDEDDTRYRIAACYLADIAWRAHPDFRAQQYMGTIANAGFVSIGHEGRAYIALANYHRYLGLGSKAKTPPIADLASKRTVKKARILAAMFRVLYLFSGTVPNIIPKIGLKMDGKKKVVLEISEEISSLLGERPEERIRQLGKELDMSIKVEVV